MALTKVDKRATRSHKTSFIELVRAAIDEHDRLYVFTYENMRSNYFQDIRLHFRSNSNSSTMKEEDDDDNSNNNTSDKSRIFLGKNKLLQIALGRTTEEEYSDNLRHVSQLVKGGSVGLLCTNRAAAPVESYFAQLIKPDFARAGSVASHDVTLTNADLQQFPVTMMEQLRKLGLPADISNGAIVLRETSKGCEPGEYRLCKKGSVLTAEQCKLLVHFDHKVADFRVHLAGRWIKETGEFTKLA